MFCVMVLIKPGLRERDPPASFLSCGSQYLLPFQRTKFMLRGEDLLPLLCRYSRESSRSIYNEGIPTPLRVMVASCGVARETPAQGFICRLGV